MTTKTITSVKRPADNSAEAEVSKRQKVPSRVVHVRNLPLSCSQTELMLLARPFGEIVRVLVMKEKGQGLVQFGSVSEAMAMIDNYENAPVQLLDRTVYFDFSHRDEISVMSSAAPSVDTSKAVLHVTITNCIYPIDVHLLHQVFSPHGLISKILIFHKEKTQALVQFYFAEAAAEAKIRLDGLSILANGCGHLKIQFSNLSALTVRQNSDTAWDFSRSIEPARTCPTMPQPGEAAMGLYPVRLTGMPQVPLTLPGHGQIPSGGPRPGAVVMLDNVPSEITIDHLFTLCSCYGRILRIKVLFHKRDSAFVQFSAPQFADACVKNLNKVSLFGAEVLMRISKHAEITANSKDAEDLFKDCTTIEPRMHRFTDGVLMDEKALSHACPPSAVLHLSNIPTSMPMDEVKLLFEPYGPVVAVQHLPKKAGAASRGKSERQMGLIELPSVEKAISALLNVHYHRFADGGPLRVAFTKSTIPSGAK